MFVAALGGAFVFRLLSLVLLVGFPLTNSDITPEVLFCAVFHLGLVETFQGKGLHVLTKSVNIPILFHPKGIPNSLSVEYQLRRGGDFAQPGLHRPLCN